VIDKFEGTVLYRAIPSLFVMWPKRHVNAIKKQYNYFKHLALRYIVKQLFMLKMETEDAEKQE
jgi:hypothetical protein